MNDTYSSPFREHHDELRGVVVGGVNIDLHTHTHTQHDEAQRESGVLYLDPLVNQWPLR